MNKQLKLLQRSKVLKTLEVEKVKHNLSKIKNSTIVMVAYDDATDKFLIGDNSGDLYVATSEYLKSLDIKNLSINSFINGLTKTSIAQYFNKISLQEAKEMFGEKYLYYWSANNRIYGVKRGLIERLDNGPDNTTVVDLWSRTENVLSNDRGVSGLKEVKFSSELRPAFLTFDKDAIPTYERDQNLIVRDPVKIADAMNNDLHNHDYVPKDDKYGYDMKDSNAVMKAYLGTDDLVVLSNIDKRKVVDIDPPNTEPGNPDIVFYNNTPFNHNYNMIWTTIRSARLFEEFNDEANDNDSNFANTTRHEQKELTNFTLNDRINKAGLYANIPNLSLAYTTYIKGDNISDKQIYSSGIVAISIKNEFKWSLDKIDGNTCTITKRIYNPVTGEITNGKKTYEDGVVEFEIVNIKDNTVRIKRTFRIPSLNNAICDYNKFEYKHDATGVAISLPVPEEYVDGIVEYKLDTTTFEQGTNGKISYGLREIYVQSGNTKYLSNTTNGTGTASFSTYTLNSNATSATIKRNTEIIFKNTDGTNYSYQTTNNGIGTGSVEYLVANTPTGVNSSNHVSRHTRNVHYMSGSTDIICKTDYSDPIVNYEIYTLSAGSTTATLKGSSTGVFKTIVNGSETSTTYNVAKSRHITVTSDTITYTRNSETYTSTSSECSQTMNIDYSYSGVTIRKTITKSANIVHSIFALEANSSSATIKREFRPVFYTISAGIESSSNIYKNTIVEIDRNKTANVSYTVSNSVTSASGSNHYATHTRTVTYKPTSISQTYTLLNESVSAAISYTWKNLSNDSKQFYGSSSAEFNIYSKGSKVGTYTKTQTNHLSVDCTITEKDVIDTYNANTKTAHLELTGSYTYGSVTKQLIKRSDTVNININITTSSYSLSERNNFVVFTRTYSPKLKCINNGVETTNYYDDKRNLSNVEGTITQTLTVAKHANNYNFHTVIKDDLGITIVDTNSMNICDRLGGVSLKQAASMLLNNTDNAKNKVYIGDYFELGGYTWQNIDGTTFTAGTAKYVLVERTMFRGYIGNLIFMSSERHKLFEYNNGLTWKDLITNNKLEILLLPQLESILGITPVSYTRKDDIPHLKDKRVFLPTEYEIFGKYEDQKEDERYNGERQWEIFRTDKEENRKIFRRDVITGNINEYVPSDSYNGYGYWLATNSSGSGGASIVNLPDNSDFGNAGNNGVNHPIIGVRPCFML